MNICNLNFESNVRCSTIILQKKNLQHYLLILEFLEFFIFFYKNFLYFQQFKLKYKKKFGMTNLRHVTCNHITYGHGVTTCDVTVCHHFDHVTSGEQITAYLSRHVTSQRVTYFLL